ncbi:MAG: efflux RND transporter periplasmic adaptor subunit [Rhodobacter sp.]|nr:efflux RND transporter periplasmic adaptor subunit [Paracoccaceae bacterium]MCC0075140.1 efflux RND transporter periplasmic adaptor subunit [Rhodobacter sp.]
MPRRAAHLRFLRSRPFAVFLLVAPLVLMAGTAEAQGRPPGAGGPAQVGVVEVTLQDVPYVRTLPGRAVAYEDAAIRPRVSGAVEEILYDAGARVAVGDPLFRIEDATYRAAVSSAEAAVASAEAAASVADATAQRYRNLQGNVVTSADLQSAEASAASARATLTSARAALSVAQLDLERTVIRSPISGIAGTTDVTVGTLVTANQATALATVTRLDPIYVDVSDSSAGMLRIRRMINRGELTLGESVGLQLLLETGEGYDRQGEMVTMGNAVSASTGTVDFRIRFDNPDRLILPGQFLRVNVTLGTRRAFLVPQRATSRGSDGALTAWVARDGKAVQTTLTEAGTWGNAWVVSAGLEDGDTLIVDGLTGLVAGRDVAPLPVEIDAAGVVRDLPAATNGAAPAAAAGH